MLSCAAPRPPAFADRTRLQYSRSELYLGRAAEARGLLSGVVDRRAAYWFYRFLTLIPHPFFRLGLVSRSAARRMRTMLNVLRPTPDDRGKGVSRPAGSRPG
jgi:hypothetical protein